MNKICIVILSLFLLSCSSSKVRTNKTYSTKKVSATKKTEIVKKESQNNTTKIEEINKPKKENQELIATSKVKATQEDVLKYISDFKEIAKENMVNHGIPASITMAQGILESGAGFGRLCKEANNHFGIKCHTGWTGETITHDDDAAQECFRKYEDPSQSYRDHSLFLKTRKRYESLFQLEKYDYYSWANGLKQAGYATDTLYPSKLIGIIERYELHKLDSEVLGVKYKKPTPVPVKSVNIETKEVRTVLNDNEYLVKKGDTLYSLSKKFNLSIEEIKSKNNIPDTGISIGQKLIIK